MKGNEGQQGGVLEAWANQLPPSSLLRSSRLKSGNFALAICTALEVVVVNDGVAAVLCEADIDLGPFDVVGRTARMAFREFSGARMCRPL
jgi:hypothetical protein